MNRPRTATESSILAMLSNPHFAEEAAMRQFAALSSVSIPAGDLRRQWDALTPVQQEYWFGQVLKTLYLQASSELLPYQYRDA